MSRLRTAVALLCAVVVLGSGTSSALPATAASATAAPVSAAAGGSAGAPLLADVRVGGCIGRTVPPGYLGLSVEWSMVERWAGADVAPAERARLPFVQVLRSLRTQAGAGGVLRIGGDSQDGYVWSELGPRSGNRLFQGVVDGAMVEAVLDVARHSGWKVVLGVNLRSGLTPGAVALARHAVRHDRGRTLLGLEVGNEPDAYHPSLGSYLQAFDLFADSLARDPSTARLPLYGPALATGGDLSWLRSLRDAQRPRLAELTWHDYANRPTLDALFDPAVSRQWQARIRESLHQAGDVPVRVEEANSVGLGGLPRVSDVTGSTPWLVDTLLTGAAAGLAGYGVHTWDGHDHPSERRTSYYTPFVVRGGKAFPRPPFYALALLRDLPGRRFCGLRTARQPGAAVKAWAVARPSAGRLGVVLTNPAGAGSGGRVRVSLPAGYAATGRTTTLRDVRGCGGRSASLSGAVLPHSGTFRERTTAATAVDGSFVLALGPCATVRLDLVRSTRPA